MATRLNPYPLTLLYDRACPVCRVEMEQLARRDVLGRLVLVDISDPGFDLAVADHLGTALTQLVIWTTGIRNLGDAP